MSEIDDKYAQLKHGGLDLGMALGSEAPAHSGGRMREYQEGSIYWHHNTGAHEVHGGILGVYLANGGPGISSTTGQRALGYPTSDEIPGTTPQSRFEFGDIYWTSGAGGCLVPAVIRGRLAQGPQVGLPITSAIAVAGGQAVFFERGVIFSSFAAGKSRVIVGHVNPPLIGLPTFMNPDNPEERTLYSFCTWSLIEKEDYDALTSLHPSLFTEIFNGRYAYSPVGRVGELIPLTPTQTHTFGSFQFDVKVNFALAAGGPHDFEDRTLYDFSISLPNGNRFVVSPHCLYTKKSWDDFGLLHVTDIHVSKRNDGLRGRLIALGLSEAAVKYCNFQDNLRDFIKYANKLHRLGLADIILATGDLVDYAEEDIGKYDPYTNFWRLRQILLGKPIDDNPATGEELQLPILTTFGNHDYRVHPYNYKSVIDYKIGRQTIDQFGSHNLIESDAIALQDGKVPTYGLSDANEAIRSLKVDQTRNAYRYYDRYFGGGLGYTIPLGRHRIIVMDTQSDEGIPADIDAAFFINKLSGNLHESTERLLSGKGPNSVGFSEHTIASFRSAIAEAPLDGVVIVGMHAPALSPNSGQYPYYLRETLHPSADQAELLDYHGSDALPAMTGKSYFLVGDPKDKLGVGIGWNKNLEFLEACAGVGLSRPVDLILCGHVHDRVEYRFRSNGSRLQFYTDFYTENPRSYYAVKSVTDRPDLPKGSTITVEIGANAASPPNVMLERDHRTNPNKIYGKAITPPYPTPLDSATNPAAWWQAHRPLHAETASLGPIESRQRYGTFYELSYTIPLFRNVVETDRGQPAISGGQSIKILPPPVPNPTFQGFRLVQIANNVIARMRYITLAELRLKGFNLSWEPKVATDSRLPGIGAENRHRGQ